MVDAISDAEFAELQKSLRKDQRLPEAARGEIDSMCEAFARAMAQTSGEPKTAEDRHVLKQISEKALELAQLLDAAPIELHWAAHLATRRHDLVRNTAAHLYELPLIAEDAARFEPTDKKANLALLISRVDGILINHFGNGVTRSDKADHKNFIRLLTKKAGYECGRGSIDEAMKYFIKYMVSTSGEIVGD
jgi:hypothetical protein